MVQSDFPDTRDIVPALFFLIIPFVIHLIYFMKSSVPDGSDAYVYLVQARSLVEKGSLHYPDLSIVHPLMAFFYLLINNPVIAYKSCCAFLCAAGTVAFYCSIRMLRGKRITAIALALLLAVSPLTGFFACQFPKQFLGMIFVVLFIGSLARGRIFLSAVFIALAYFSHRTGAVCAMVIFLADIIMRRKKIRMVLCILMIIIIPAMVVSFIPGTLNKADLGRFSGTFSSLPGIAPFSFMNIHGRGEMHPLLWIDACFLYLCGLAGIISCTAGILRRSRIPRWYMSLGLLLCILLFPWFVIEGQSMGYRLFLSAIFISPLCIIPLTDNLAVKNVTPVITVYLVLGICYITLDNSSRYSPPYNLYDKITDRAGKHLSSLKVVDLVVAHRPLSEMIDFKLRKDALAWKPEVRFERSRTWRIVWNIESWEIEHHLKNVKVTVKNGDIIVLSPMYIMVREDMWEKFTRSLQRDEEINVRVYSEMNPFRERPFFITRGRR